MKEFEVVALNVDLPEHGLERGDLGTVVHVHPGEVACLVEFITLDGETVAVETLLADQVRRVRHREIAHARPVGPNSR